MRTIICCLITVLVMLAGCHPDRVKRSVSETPRIDTCWIVCNKPECIDSGLVGGIDQEASIASIRLDPYEMPPNHDGPWPWSPTGILDISDSIANKFQMVLFNESGQAVGGVSQKCTISGTVRLYPSVYGYGLPSGFYTCYVFHNGTLIGKSKLPLIK